MLRTLKDLFEDLLTPTGAAAPEDPVRRRQLATAVLLVEVMRADAGFGEEERLQVLDTLRRRFALGGDEAQRLLALAKDQAHHAVDFHAWTSALNAQLDHPQKVQLLEDMWGVAYADGALAAHEQHVMWRIADLLHVPHGAYINAKLRAKAAAGA